MSILTQTPAQKAEFKAAMDDSGVVDTVAREQLGAISSVATDLALGANSLIRRTPAAAQIAEAAAAYAGTTLDAIEQAIGDVPTDTRIAIEASSIDVLKQVPVDTPMGRLALLVPEGRYGPWQLRPGDYSAQIAADTYNTLYAKVDGIPATVAAWVRIIPGRLCRHCWSGLDADTADALPFLKSTFSLFPGWSKWELPNHIMRMPTNAHPALTIHPAGVELYGFGEKSLIDYTGAYINFTALIQVVNSDTYVHDVFGKLVAPNNSAGNPAFIAVGADRDLGDEPDIAPDIDRTRIRDVGFGRCSTGVLFGAYSPGKGLPGFKRPREILIDNVHGTNNGAAVSAFGAEGVEVSRYDFRYDPTLPAGAPAAKKLGFRVLGTVDMEIKPGLVQGYETGVALDAAYFGGNRALNKNISVGAIEIRDSILPIVAAECDGEFIVDGAKIRYDTNYAGALLQPAVRVNGNLPLSTVPPGGALPNSIVGNVTVRNMDVEGMSVAVYAQGTMGKLDVTNNVFVGNKSQGMSVAQRGAVLTVDAFGIPEQVRVVGNDFLMTVAEGQPSLQLQSSSGIIECTDNVLPERVAGDERNSLIVPRGNVIFTDKAEQRPFNAFANLGSNRLHPVGALANYRDKTPLPAQAITSVPWTRDKTAGVTENPANTFTKTTATVAYDERISSGEGMTGDFEFVYRLKGIYEDMAVGLDPVANTASAFSMDWCLYYGLGGSGFGNASVYTNGVAISGTGAAYSSATIERWRRVGAQLMFSRNGVDLFSTSVSPDIAFKLQASLARQGDAVEILRFGEIK